MRILVVEDDTRLAENLVAGLREGGSYAVDHAANGIEAQHLAMRDCYDLILLDLMIPGQDGLTTLRHLRSLRNTTPVVVLTAQDAKDSTVKLLNAGADDYLSKPFDLGELLARVKAVIRRSKGGADSVLVVSDVELYTLEQRVQRAGQSIDLSPTEFRILEYLMHRPRVVIGKRELLEHLYDYNWEHHSNVIEAHMSNLRRKLSLPGLPPLIETLRYRGYRLFAAQLSSV